MSLFRLRLGIRERWQVELEQSDHRHRRIIALRDLKALSRRLYVPDSQDIQAVSPRPVEKVAEAQRAHTVCPTLFDEEPGMHCRHVSDDDALCVTEYVPILHKLQYHRPPDVEKVPV